MENVIDRDHPSYGAKRASFLFTIGTKLLLVEANNPHAVATLERVLINNNQTVSETCRVLCVFRNCDSGIRDESVDEVLYIEFMTDIVDSNHILNDDITSTCFSQSVTPREREYMANREKALDLAAGESVQEVPVREEIPENRNNLFSALSGMGFKKKEVEKFISGLGPRVNEEPITNLIREGLRSLA